MAPRTPKSPSRLQPQRLRCAEKNSSRQPPLACGGPKLRPCCPHIDPFGFEPRRDLWALRQRRIGRHRSRRDEQDHVLPIPPGHPTLVAKFRPERIEHPESELGEDLSPIGKRLAVDVPSAALTRRCCGKKDLWCRGSKLLHQMPRIARRQMFGNFEADGQVESIRRNLERSAENGGTKAIGGKQQRRCRYVFTIESDDFFYSIRDEGAQPRAAAATDVQHTRRTNQLH